MNKWDCLEETLKNLKRENLYRHITEFASSQSKEIIVNGRKMLLFASNSYLDLCNVPEVKDYASKIALEYGTGSGGSRLTTGTTDVHMRLEEILAGYKGREASIVFNTGYMGNVGTISALAGKGDVIFSDELNHASIIDGCRLSKANLVIYKHNDMVDLEMKVKEYISNKTNGSTAEGAPVKANNVCRGLIVSDGVFSMDGDIVNLPELVEIADGYNLFSMIDEAHATGVIGETGRGTEEYYHMEGKVDILMGTLSKSIGSEGGFVCGSRTLVEFLINKARSYIFSTSLSPVTMGASYMSIKYIMEHNERVERLQHNIKYFCHCLTDEGIDVKSDTSIIPIIIGDEKKALEVSEELKNRGYYVSAIRYPTVAKGCARLRVALMATHTDEELLAFSKSIGQVYRKMHRI
ncbi:MAG: aminotransferase class I/II-fold pyridoxal phosphate-dependent enzyme [Anaerocolumna sp.]